MFYSLTGTIVNVDATSVAIDCNGMAFLCLVSMNTLKRIDGEGMEATLYTYLNVKQDGVDLFGFHSKEELNTFKLLTSVSGVGPKAALAILSVLEPSQLAIAVAGSDTKAIQQAQGVGKKVADRVILELKDKIAKGLETGSLSEDYKAAAASTSGNSDMATAIAALVQMGYSQSEASIAVGKVDPALPAAKMVTAALKHLM